MALKMFKPFNKGSKLKEVNPINIGLSKKYDIKDAFLSWEVLNNYGYVARPDDRVVAVGKFKVRFPRYKKGKRMADYGSETMVNPTLADIWDFVQHVVSTSDLKNTIVLISDITLDGKDINLLVRYG